MTPPLPLALSALSETQAREVCAWRYPAPWDIYDMGPWDRVLTEGYGLGIPEIRAREFLAVTTGRDELVAYLRLSSHGGRWMLGVGLHPERCGGGLGGRCVTLGWVEHRHRRPDAPLWLEVRDWNTRAARCYAAAGFEPAGTVERTTALGPGTFLMMSRSMP